MKITGSTYKIDFKEESLAPIHENLVFYSLPLQKSNIRIGDLDLGLVRTMFYTHNEDTNFIDIEQVWSVKKSTGYSSPNEYLSFRGIIQLSSEEILAYVIDGKIENNTKTVRTLFQLIQPFDWLCVNNYEVYRIQSIINISDELPVYGDVKMKRKYNFQTEGLSY